MNEKILILDFGSQLTQLIGRRLRELNVYCEIFPYHHFPEPDESVKGVILSGSPYSVMDKNAPEVDLTGIKGYIPLLGICFGAQYLATHYGGAVHSSLSREYGRAMLNISVPESPLFKNVPSPTAVWMSHGDSIDALPESAVKLASTPDVQYAAFCFEGEETYAVQFHPEVYHSVHGTQILENFARDICRCQGDWTPSCFIENTVDELREKMGREHVILALSGGVDSTVAAVLLHKAIGKQLHCIFVDTGLLRLNEFASVMKSYEEMELNFTGVDASGIFLPALRGITDPEIKRKTIGRIFIEVFNREASRINNATWLAQGTIYPDVIESVSVYGHSSVIKSHHNVGGLPEHVPLKIVEPLRMLFKDEVRRIGLSLGIKKEFINRHPFPGPGLAIRLLGEITPEKLAILRQADDIFISSLKKEGLYDSVWQAGAVLLPVKSVGVMGDERTYEYTVALRAVESSDGMTADWVDLPYEFLRKVSNEIINKVQGVNRVVYDISSKPPATIEWE
ncbi:MAG: glutamine-hydrolyzing GMP synthase [Bacteroidales bacterium]|jgi:GMP synthase (glutamine-hydrolysing)|nr:glutamine-hydrolyzing GMP synthase [Bacteroidales bacterium]MDD2264611.1 glutamine-hydrolyzing GMP synthase [Bacteroidales bacterium]MDD2831994.1 glutamine-hydrolyzing GMP synthase [Bacteroidales bacterium]MDD3208997.1 glutamine-hydrolyzing GMP synthase [Bacteroidales bacterium]MDD3697831.1 glutamine-hydrolyzing GMP synthase [Bacteroidales bacterium]